MAKKIQANLVEPIDLQVTYEGGKVADYTTCPLDVWRAEKMTHRSIAEAVDTFEGLSALAYSCALRAGDAYKKRSKGTSEGELFEQWITGVDNIAMLVDDDEADDGEEDDDRPLDQAADQPDQGSPAG